MHAGSTINILFNVFSSEVLVHCNKRFHCSRRCARTSSILRPSLPTKPARGRLPSWPSLQCRWSRNWDRTSLSRDAAADGSGWVAVKYVIYKCAFCSTNQSLSERESSVTIKTRSSSRVWRESISRLQYRHDARLNAHTQFSYALLCDNGVTRRVRAHIARTNRPLQRIKSRLRFAEIPTLYTAAQRLLCISDVTYCVNKRHNCRTFAVSKYWNRKHH